MYELITTVYKVARRFPDLIPLLGKLVKAIASDPNPLSAVERATVAALAKRAVRGGSLDL
jgi:hypothetical protein